MIKNSPISSESVLKLLPLDNDLIMYSQYDGMIGIKNVHIDQNENICCIYLKNAIYDMEIAYEDKS